MPDVGDAGATYRWERETIAGAMPLRVALDIAKQANGSRSLEIRLLHQAGSPATLYSGTVRLQ